MTDLGVTVVPGQCNAVTSPYASYTGPADNLKFNFLDSTPAGRSESTVTGAAAASAACQ
jgi:hypothetical protein